MWPPALLFITTDFILTLWTSQTPLPYRQSEMWELLHPLIIKIRNNNNFFIISPQIHPSPNLILSLLSGISHITLHVLAQLRRWTFFFNRISNLSRKLKYIMPETATLDLHSFSPIFSSFTDHPGLAGIVKKRNCLIRSRISRKSTLGTATSAI